MDWQDLHHFVVVARRGSLTAAAKELRVDPATVGRRIASLETTLGVTLVDRLPRATRLSDAGRALAQILQPMESFAEQAGRQAGGDKALSGTVKLSILPALASALVAPGLARLRQLHPGLQIVIDARSDVASLEKGEADIAIGLVRPRLAGRVVRKVGAMRLGLYAAPDVAGSDSASWQFTGFDAPLEGIPQQRWLSRFAAGRPFALRSNDVVTQLASTRAGIGVATLPCFLADRDAGVARIVLDDAPPSRDVWMSVHADVRRSPAVRTVMDHLVALLASELV